MFWTQCGMKWWIWCRVHPTTSLSAIKEGGAGLRRKRENIVKGAKVQE